MLPTTRSARPPGVNVRATDDRSVSAVTRQAGRVRRQEKRAVTVRAMPWTAEATMPIQPTSSASLVEWKSSRKGSLDIAKAGGAGIGTDWATCRDSAPRRTGDDGLLLSVQPLLPARRRKVARRRVTARASRLLTESTTLVAGRMTPGRYGTGV